SNGQQIETDDLILAIGHSARDTYQMLFNRKLDMKSKPFAIGLRIEHLAEMINKSQYGKNFNHPKLPVSNYKCVAHLPNLRSVYTFCMCPGGYVIAAASEESRLATNGMSESNRNCKNSNSALLVNVGPKDFASEHPLAGIEFQRLWENRAFIAGGGGYRAPAQLVGDFLNHKASNRFESVAPTYKPGVTLTSLETCLPDYVINAIREALPIFDRKIKGFACRDALLTGVETRSSAPVKILRDDSLESVIKGIYPAGEGAGYAGGIISSALDGLAVAESIIDKYLRSAPVNNLSPPHYSIIT
ncbi:hypothetical protein KKA14_13160, partial [bacterium]|nr:hypothetical protein [bacterium]